MYHFLQALPSFANEPPVSQEIPSSLTSIYQTQQFSSLAELGTTHRDTLMGGHSFYGHQFQPFTDILLCLPCFANIRLLNLHFSAQWSKHKTTNEKKNSCIAKIFTKPCRHLFWSIYFMVQKKRTAESFQTTQCSVSQNCT